MAKFQISTAFAGKVADTLRVSVPWPEADVSLLLFRREAPAFLARRRTSELESPVMGAYLLKELELQAEQEDAVKVVGSEGGELLEPTAPARVGFLKTMLEQVRVGRLGLDDVLFFQEQAEFREACDLIAGWEGKGVTDPDTGAAIAPSRENVRDFLGQDALVSEGYGAGLTLGKALVRFILETAEKHEAGRTALLESAAKNSEPSSGGSDAAGDGLTH